MRSLHSRLVLIMMILIVVVMAVVGVSMINSITRTQTADFLNQMAGVFSREFISELEKSSGASDAPEILKSIVGAYSQPLGIDEHRFFAVLDGDGRLLESSGGQTGVDITPNIITAMSGAPGQKIQKLSPYFDVAVPLRQADAVRYIIYVRDDLSELNEMTLSTFFMIVRAIIIGLVASVLLSFLLSKTITVPVERLTEQAQNIARGDFSALPQSDSRDEIGELAESFNDMASRLSDTLRSVENERNKLDAIFRHMSDGVVAVDHEDRMIHINLAAQRMLGHTVEPGSTFDEIFPHLIDRGDGGRGEIDYAVNSRILKIYTAPFGEDEGAGTIAVLHDITEQQKLELSQRQFVANVSHELRTPLTNIRGYAETLIDAGSDMDPETRDHFLGIIDQQAEVMTGIVSDLLTLSRLDHEDMMQQPEPVDLSELTSDQIEAMRLDAESKKVTLISKMPPSLVVEGSKPRLRQVIVNILSNAVKYNRPDGTVTVTGEEKDDCVTVRIADTGMGIPQKDLPHIFERFYRVDKARSRERGGTGLGLAIAREIVERHHGTLTAVSEENRGTEFTLTLPRGRAEELYGED